jgi:hypothetical protein
MGNGITSRKLAADEDATMRAVPCGPARLGIELSIIE